MLSEKEKTAVRKEAQEILKQFGESLSTVKGTLSETQTPGGFRDEENGRACESDFREHVFANAPRTKDECLLMEKGKW